jgi:hypothetical protein
MGEQMNSPSEYFTDARARLIPWLGPAQLGKHVEESPPRIAPELEAVARRACALNRCDLWAQPVLVALRDDPSSRNPVAGIAYLDEHLAASLARPFTSAATSVLEAPIALRANVEGTVSERDSDQTMVITTADGETMKIFLHELDGDPNVGIGQMITVDIYEDSDGDLTAIRLADASGTVMAASTTSHEPASLELKEATLKLGFALINEANALDAMLPWLEGQHASTKYRIRFH